MVLKWRNEEILAKFGDVRRFMDSNAVVFGIIDNSSLPHGQAWRVVQAHLDAQAPRHFTTVCFNMKSGF